MITKVFSFKDQQNFAALSGDFNPLHLNDIFARRSMFGEVIVHGINIVLSALDMWLGEYKTSVSLSDIEISFPKAVKLEEPTIISWINSSEEHFEIRVSQNSQLCAKIKLHQNTKGSFKTTKSFMGNVTFPDVSPSNRSINDVVGLSGTLEIAADYNRLKDTYPSVYTFLSKYQTCVLVSTTRLVGMNCPGLNSLFSGLQIQFKGGKAESKSLNFEVCKVDSRFNLVQTEIHNENVHGRLKTFVRPKPVMQDSFASVSLNIPNSTFTGQKALVIGGSRGLGEVFSKVLAAGGAEVILTYYRGKEDAEKLLEEIIAGGGKAEILQFNVLTDDLSTVLGVNHDVSHCYYMATPFIFDGIKNSYSIDLFEKFNKYYVNGFYDIVESLHSAGVINYFYPSSVAVEVLEKNMIEYTLSKLSGEKLCDFLSLKYRNINILKYRFPRIETDQTVSILPVANTKALDLAVKVLSRFSSGK